MTIEQRSFGPVTVLDLTGNLASGASGGLLKDKVHSLIFQGQTRIVLNLAGVSYMDSAGLGELIASYTTVRRGNGQIKVAGLTKRVSDLLAIAKVLTVFDVYETDTAAVASFDAAV